jgi:hypothetical protein
MAKKTVTELNGGALAEAAAPAEVVNEAAAIGPLADRSMSLYAISSQMAEMMDYWASGELEPEERQTLENAIMDYVRAQVLKVDGIAAYHRNCLAAETMLADEAKRLNERLARWRKRRERFEDTVKHVLQNFVPRDAKGKVKLDGTIATISLRGNGGALPVLIPVESDVPVEFCDVMVKIPGSMWMELEPEFKALPSTQIPNKTRIREELEKYCGVCAGGGTVRIVAPVTADTLFEDDAAPAELPPAVTCTACGGTGFRGVPGCSLGTRGETLVIK